MSITTGNIEIFKQHILSSKQYAGGATRGESKQKSSAEKVYKLSSNENLLGPSPKALEAIRKNLHLLHEYGYQGDEKLRHSLSEYFQMQLRPEQFITANSGMELLELIVRGFLDPGLECIFCPPTFKAYKNFSNLQGGKAVEVPLKGKNFDLDADGILNAVNENTRIVFLNTPNNPTGTIFPASALEELTEHLPKHVILVYDEVYWHYVDDADFPRAIDYIKRGKNVIGLHSFSKAYGLAGLRLGYAFSTPEISSYLNRIRRPFMINTLTMEAGLAALRDDEHICATKKIISEEKPWLYRQFDRLDITYWKSQANFIFFQSPVPNEISVPRMLELGIMIRPAEAFGAEGCIRVTIGTHDANMAFINALEKIMNENKTTTE
jgi:histidinol-phosphate aminotransferase